MKPVVMLLCLSLLLSVVCMSFFLSIARAQTPQPCILNEMYLECGPSCDSSCDALDVPCPESRFRCTAGCFCTPNHARNSQNHCVRNEFCSWDYRKSFIPYDKM